MEHLVGIDEQLVDDVRELCRAVVEVDGRIRQDNALDGAVGDVALMPERDVFERCDGVAAVQARHAADALAVDRVALVRHRRRALLARGEIFLGFADVRALEVADFRRNLFERRGADGDRRDEFGMTVALDDLRCEADRREAERFADHFLDFRVDVRVRADSARELADGDGLLCMLEAVDVALDFSAPEQKLQAERHRFGMDAMRAADARRVLELDGAAAQHFEEGFHVLDEDVAGIAHHHAVGRVLDVARRQAFVDVFRVIADMLGDVREERDDVVVRDRLDLVDAVDLERGLGADVLRGFLRDFPELCHRIAGGHLDVQDLLPFVLDGPEVAHLGPGVTFNHVFRFLLAKSRGECRRNQDTKKELKRRFFRRLEFGERYVIP